MKAIYRIHTLLLLVAIALCSLSLTACSDDDDDDNVTPSTTVQEAFEALYPDVTVQEWELEGTYYVADFRLDGASSEAWFTADGEWVKTETDVTYASLPDAVKATLSEQYASYTIDDIEYVETPSSGNYYLVELELGSQDIYVKIDAEGNVL